MEGEGPHTELKCTKSPSMTEESKSYQKLRSKSSTRIFLAGSPVYTEYNKSGEVIEQFVDGSEYREYLRARGSVVRLFHAPFLYVL